MTTENLRNKQLSINNEETFKSNLELVIIYQITCKNPSVKENYIGQTVSFEKRKYSHSRDSKISELKIYKTIRKHGGWDNWDMKIMNCYYCKDEYEARQIEQKYMEIFKSTMNSNRAYSKSLIDMELDRKLSFELNNHDDRILGCYVYDYLDLELEQEQKEKEKEKGQKKDNQTSCKHCDSVFKTKSSLNNHKNAKYCLEIQEKKAKKSYKCEFCDKILSTKQSLTKHKDTCCKRKDIHNNELKELRDKELRKLTDEIIEKDKIIIKVNTQLENFKEQLEKQEESYKEQLEKKEKQEENYKEQIKDLQEKLNKIANKAIDRELGLSVN